MGGDLRYIVALDAEHHIFLSTWARAFPDAKLIGPAGLPEKRARMADSGDDDMIGREPFAVVFPSRTSKVEIDPEDFDRDFAYEFVDAHPNKELVFFYRPDRVLIEADLMFNLPANEQYSRAPGGSPGGMLARIFSSFQTTEGDAKGMKRFLWYVISRGDRKGFNESVQRIDSWDFDTIIPCHGDTIQGNAKAVFEKVFAWHLQGHK
jgi:glyoxylase-like metal-dependent hydrolase (beta-lactamase superfamily II)